MVRSTEEFRGLLKAARRAGTPLLAIRTADPATAIAQVTTTVGEKSALLQWDLMTGIRGINRAGVEIVAKPQKREAASCCFPAQTIRPSPSR